MKAHFIKHKLQFRFPAGTSRGVLREKTSWFIMLENKGKQGIGEAGPLPGLSPDKLSQLDGRLSEICTALLKEEWPEKEAGALKLAAKLAGTQWPAIRFAIETALLDWQQGGRRILFDNAFSRGEQPIPINGLIWMGEKESMRERMQQKLKEGFNCLKMKIGAINFKEECAILEEVREHYPPEIITLRVDANGAFTPEEAPDKLKMLAQYQLHSIEQPIRAGQPEAMHHLCRISPVPVALDEELIGVDVEENGRALLEQIRPQYIILKPSLLGGIAASRKWIALAEELEIGWWMTSALESNIGLNAIGQFAATCQISGPQGLGTGQLYYNNIPAPLEIVKGSLQYNPAAKWDLTILNQ
jgi:O-succinylbenzoate synthase